MWDAEERIGCQECIFWTNQYGVEPCQHRIDHKRVKTHYASFQTCYDNQLGRFCPCSDFQPKPSCKYIYEHWEDFDTYVEGYKTTWGRHGKMFYDGLTWLHLNGKLYDKPSTPEYAVRTYDLVFGHPYNFETGELDAIKKRYHRKCRRSEIHPLGFVLVVEDIDGVNVMEVE